jgi:hypothetical protein
VGILVLATRKTINTTTTKSNNMEVEVKAVIEDTDILYYINEYEQSKVLEDIFNECTEEQQQRFISNLDDSYLIEELESRGFTITENE